ncbi:hypothetical protein THAPSDRAFT_264928, partial [Thalassiosira pseudonana CCMP1335]
MCLALQLQECWCSAKIIPCILCMDACASLFIANSSSHPQIDCSHFFALHPLQRRNDPPSTKSPSQAPTMTTIQKMIRGCDGAANDQFGYDLAVKGDWAAIGAYGVSSYTGAVYLYKHDAEWDWFGYTVALSGTGHLVVGARGDDDKGYNSGSVYLLTLNSSSNTWGDEQKIVASDGAASDNFGDTVAMSGTGHLVVGAPYEDDKGSNAGAVYLLTLNSSSNTWGDEQKIVASDGAASDNFGDTVAMSGTGHLVVGAPYEDDKGSNAGAVYLYTLNSTSNTWGNEQKIVASDGAADDNFGVTVAM